MSDAILATLLRGNLALSGAILLILALRRPLRRRFGAVAAYAFWVTAPVCLLVALLPPTAPAGLLAPVVAGAADAASAVPKGETGPTWRSGLVLLWFLGVIATAAVFTIRQRRFVRSLGRLAPWPRDKRLVQSEHIGTGPLVLGTFRPRIVLPADFETRFSGEARALILAHEGVHLARGDAAINALTVALQCFAWWNPLIHWAAQSLRIDQEIACDAVVLARRPGARRLYAGTLVEAATLPVVAPLACGWPAGGLKPLKERLVTMSAASPPPQRRVLGLGVVLALGVVAGGVVWAANPIPSKLVLTPVWRLKPSGADLALNYPDEARKAGIEGAATIQCGVGADGRLGGCTVLREAPAGLGFGKAAVRLSSSFQMNTVSGDGRRVAGGVVRIPILYRATPPQL